MKNLPKHLLRRSMLSYRKLLCFAPGEDFFFQNNSPVGENEVPLGIFSCFSKLNQG